jgi:hypothetical protein
MECLNQVYKQFKEGQKRILVATDLVGRGIDIERVNIVINYDMPETDERHGNGADSYLHRVRAAEMDWIFSSSLSGVTLFFCSDAFHGVNARSEHAQCSAKLYFGVHRLDVQAALARRGWRSRLSPLSRTVQC